MREYLCSKRTISTEWTKVTIEERILDFSSLATRLAAAFALNVLVPAKWLAAQRAVDVRSFVRFTVLSFIRWLDVINSIVRRQLCNCSNGSGSGIGGKLLVAATAVEKQRASGLLLHIFSTHLIHSIRSCFLRSQRLQAPPSPLFGPHWTRSQQRPRAPHHSAVASRYRDRQTSCWSFLFWRTDTRTPVHATWSYSGRELDSETVLESRRPTESDFFSQQKTGLTRLTLNCRTYSKILCICSIPTNNPPFTTPRKKRANIWSRNYFAKIVLIVQFLHNSCSLLGNNCTARL